MSNPNHLHFDYHPRRSIRKAWSVATVGGGLSVAALFLSLQAPVQVWWMQVTALCAVLGSGVAAYRLGSERVSTRSDGVVVVRAFSRRRFVPWSNLAAVDTRSDDTPDSPLSHHGVNYYVAQLFDEEPPPTEAVRISGMSLMTAQGERVPLPSPDAAMGTLIHECWRGAQSTSRA